MGIQTRVGKRQRTIPPLRGGSGYLLFFLCFSLFLWAELGLFLVFPFAFILTSFVTHICFSVIEKNVPLNPVRLP